MVSPVGWIVETNGLLIALLTSETLRQITDHDQGAENARGQFIEALRKPDR